MLRVEQIPTGQLMTNCYLLWEEWGRSEDLSEVRMTRRAGKGEEGGKRKGVIIDPGDDAQKILMRVRNHNIEVDKILATHCHFDHIGAVAQLKRELDAEFIIHKDDLSYVRDCKNAARKWGFHIEQPDDPDRFIDEGDTIMVGSSSLEVVHTPGHSPGGVSYLNDTMAFVGDCLFQGSIGRTDFHMGSFAVLEKSIKEKLYTLPDDTKVYTGHGPQTTIGHEKKYNPFVRP